MRIFLLAQGATDVFADKIARGACRDLEAKPLMLTRERNRSALLFVDMCLIVVADALMLLLVYC